MARTGDLRTLRQVFAQFCVAIVLVSVVVVLLFRDREPDDAPVAVAAIGATGIASLVAGRRVARRLDCSSDHALTNSYRTRFFLRLAVAEVPVLVAFVITIALGPWWVYFVGLPFTIIGFALAAPTDRNLELDDRALRAEGCHRSLTRLLGTP